MGDRPEPRALPLAQTPASHDENGSALRLGAERWDGVLVHQPGLKPQRGVTATDLLRLMVQQLLTRRLLGVHEVVVGRCQGLRGKRVKPAMHDGQHLLPAQRLLCSELKRATTD